MRLRVCVAVVLAAGCGKVLGAEFDGASFQPDAGIAGSGGAGSGGAGGGGGAAGSGGGGSCIELHVSPTGDDASSGCDPASPKKTIGSALELSRVTPAVQSIKVCAGSYDERVVLDQPLALLGGFSCLTWSRVEGYGFPSFDPTHETVIGGSQLPEALLVTAGATAAATVDGFTITGSKSAGVQDSIALHVELAASASIQNCQILGGSGISVSGDGSVGVRIDTGAAPEIRMNRIDGGSGITYFDEAEVPVGRAAVVIDGASPYLHDNEIHGGTAAPEESYSISSAGIVLRDAQGLTEAKGKPLANNDIRGGDGNSKLPGTIASVGLLALGSSEFDLVESSVRPGKCLGAGVILRGVHSLATGSVRIVRSRIFGGDLANPVEPAAGFRVGVWIDDAQSFVAENAMIYGGVPIVGFSTGSPSFALALGNVSGAVIRHSTLYSGPSGYPTVGTALKLNPGVTGTVVQSSILAADAGWNEPIYSEVCASLGSLARLENNLFLNTGQASPGVMGSLYGYGPEPGGTCGPWGAVFSVDELTTHVLEACTAQTPGPCAGFAGAKLSGNKTLAQSCGTDSGCTPWPACNSTTSLACLQSVFENWSESDNGLGALFGPGWKLKPGVPCAIAQSSLDVGVATDLFGTPRTPAPSIGAHELDGTCSKP